MEQPLIQATEMATRAAELIGGERDRQHGAKKDNFNRIAIGWNAWLSMCRDTVAYQVEPLIEGLPAEIIMADTAYDSHWLRNAIADKVAIAVIPNNRSRAQK